MTVTIATRSVTEIDDTTPVSATVINDGPLGNMGWGELDANTTGTITTENAIVITNVPVNSAGRLLEVTADLTMRATGPTGLQVLLFMDSTELLRRDLAVSAGSLDVESSPYILVHSPDTGNHDFTLAYGISGGGGETVNILADTNKLTTLVVNDIGPDSS